MKRRPILTAFAAVLSAGCAAVEGPHRDGSTDGNDTNEPTESHESRALYLSSFWIEENPPDVEPVPSDEEPVKSNDFLQQFFDRVSEQPEFERGDEESETDQLPRRGESITIEIPDSKRSAVRQDIQRADYSEEGTHPGYYFDHEGTNLWCKLISSY